VARMWRFRLCALLAAPLRSTRSRNLLEFGCSLNLGTSAAYRSIFDSLDEDITIVFLPTILERHVTKSFDGIKELTRFECVFQMLEARFTKSLKGR
jgi:hypothetical protein